MKKIAIFVEGQTEQFFALKLISEIVGTRGLIIEPQTKSDLRKKKISLELIISSSEDPIIKWYFLIYDCCGGIEFSDESPTTVISDIIDHLPSLEKASFSHIIGIRDVYPLPDIEKLRRNLYFAIPKSCLPIKIVLAVREIEAWFMAEELHYSQINSKLTLDNVNHIAGIDVSSDSTEIIEHPADIFKQIYKTVNIGYTKRARQVQRVVEALDYANLYLEVRKRNKSLNELLDCLDGILSDNTETT